MHMHILQYVPLDNTKENLFFYQFATANSVKMSKVFNLFAKKFAAC